MLTLLWTEREREYGGACLRKKAMFPKKHQNFSRYHIGRFADKQSYANKDNVEPYTETLTETR